MTTRSPIQISTQIGTRNITLSAENAEEAVALSKELADVADGLLDTFTTLDQMILAKSPHPAAPPQASSPSATAGRSAPPPSGDVPSCPEHGPAKDMAGRYSKAGKAYRSRYYCSSYDCKSFTPTGEWIA